MGLLIFALYMQNYFMRIFLRCLQTTEHNVFSHRNVFLHFIDTIEVIYDFNSDGANVLSQWVTRRHEWKIQAGVMSM